jgi:Protein of unknown function DUF262
MRLLPSDPDVETIVSRIASRDLDLQPEFQRGEVWSRAKKQRLVDSILRDWHVPPVHVIENPESRKQEVLDGQQRLAAIRDFVDNQFPVHGDIEPFDNKIQSLGGLLYRDLPDEWRRRVNRFTIRVFRIVDYNASEPAELFFRLNQPTSLTGAEQRNAFFGPVRQQIKDLVLVLDSEEIGKSVLGFSNSRMAYDDVLSRTALALQRRSIAEKITSADLTDLYRSDVALSNATIEMLRSAIQVLGVGLRSLEPTAPKFNKATVFSWLIFLLRSSVQGRPFSAEQWVETLMYFETLRYRSNDDSEWSTRMLANCAPVSPLLSIYESRSSSRVSDVSSVILRDAVIWLTLEDLWLSSGRAPDLATFGLDRIHSAFNSSSRGIEDDLVARKMIEGGWGDLS